MNKPQPRPNKSATFRNLPSQMRIVRPNQAGQRLDQFLALTYDGRSRGEARRAIADGQIHINGIVVRVMSRTVTKGDRITWEVPPPPEPETPEEDAYHATASGSADKSDASKASGAAPAPLPPLPPVSFLYRDSYMAIINKPAGVPVEPTKKDDLRTSLRQIEAVLREEGLMAKRIYVTAAHRLDAGASGAVAFALRKQAAAVLSGQFANHSAKRIYWAIVVGSLEKDQGKLSFSIDHIGPGVRRGVTRNNRGKPATTRYRVLERFANATLIEVQLETGRTHQIRVHMSHIGHPLVGDWLYCSEQDAQRCPPAPRMMLHAHTLSLKHPNTNETIQVEAPLDEDFTGYIELLRGPQE